MAAALRPGSIIELIDTRLATVRFIGPTAFAPGTWIGVEFDDPTGKNDGSVQGQRYFDCELGHGMFLRETGVARVVGEEEPPQQTIAKVQKEKPQTQQPAVQARRQSSITGAGRTGVGGGSTTASGGANGRVSGVGFGAAKGPRPGSMEARRTSIPGGRASPPKRPTSISNPPPPRTRTSITGPASKRMSLGPTSQASNSTATGTSTGTSRTGRPSLMGPSTLRSTSGASTPGRSAIGGARSGLSPAKTSPTLTRAGRPPSTSSGISSATAASRTASGTGTGIGGGAAGGGTAANSAIQKQNAELETKLRVLEKQRAEDRERLKTLDKLQQERDKFESIIQKLQAKYQPQQQEVVQLRKQMKEAEAALGNVEMIQAEHDSAMEMATLDREMAEEMAEGMKTELEALKAKLEEMQLENEILHEENQELGQEMSPEEKTSKGWLQMERENDRLREALLRLRDMSLEQEAELRDQVKGLEEDVQDLGTVKQEYATTKERLLECEADIDDLKQQLEAALGAEEMIEELTEKNMSLSETIEELRATVDDLHSLKELNDELEINHIENEKQLQEVIDYKDMLISEQVRRAAQRDETLTDQEYTIARFRELVTNLQSDLEDMRASKEITETEAHELTTRSRTMMDLNRQLAASAANTKAKTIDMELRKLDAQEAAEHLDIVQLFLPDAFRAEKDSVLALLRFKRIGFKANLVHGFVRDKVAAVADSGAAAGTAQSDEDVFYACDALDKLMWIAAMCTRFSNGISSCSLEQFARFEGALYELEPVERALNGYIEALKRDELHERAVVDELQRSIAVMTHLAETRLDNDHNNNNLESYADDLIMRALVTQSSLENIASALSLVTASVQSALPSSSSLPTNPSNRSSSSLPSSDSVDPAISEPETHEEPSSETNDNSPLANFTTRTTTIISQTRSAKVIISKTLHALQELRARSLALQPTATIDSSSSSSNNAFSSAQSDAISLATYARTAGSAVWALLHEEGRNEPISLADVRAALNRATAEYYNSSQTGPTDSEPFFAALSTHLRRLTDSLGGLYAAATDLTLTAEFESPPPPWHLRSAALAASKLSSADAEAELRRARDEAKQQAREVKMREQRIEEQGVKIETLEARMREAGRRAERVKELEREREEWNRRERELEGALERGVEEMRVRVEREGERIRGEVERARDAAANAAAGNADADGAGGGNAGGAEGAMAGAGALNGAAGSGSAADALAGLRRFTSGGAALATGISNGEVTALRTEIAVLEGANRYLRRAVRRAEGAELKAAVAVGTALDRSPTSTGVYGRSGVGNVGWLSIPIKPAAVRKTPMVEEKKGNNGDESLRDANGIGMVDSLRETWKALEDLAKLPDMARPIRLGDDGRDGGTTTSVSTASQQQQQDNPTAIAATDPQHQPQQDASLQKKTTRLAWRPRKETPQYALKVLEEMDAWALDALRGGGSGGGIHGGSGYAYSHGYGYGRGRRVGVVI